MNKGTRSARDEEFKKFEELARKLVAVPKEELDEQRDACRESKDESAKPDV